jgi:hypothetical protein
MHMAEPSLSEGCSLTYYLDSGMSGNYIPDLDNLHDLRMYSVLKNIQMASGTYVQAKGVGMLRLIAEDDSGPFTAEVLNVKWTPGIRVCLLNHRALQRWVQSFSGKGWCHSCGPKPTKDSQGQRMQ